MRAARMKQSGIPMARTWPLRRAIAVLLSLAVLGFGSASADQAAAPKAPAVTQKTAPNAGKHVTAARASPAPKPATEQAAPELPDWPANDHPTQATIEWNSQGLRIDAANSSLQQILKEVSTTTGTTVSGVGADQRIFGTYGPGPARDVLSQLLVGSGYNVLMIGDQGQGTPRQIVLSKRPSGPASPSMKNNSSQGSEDNSSADVEEPQPPPQPEPPPPAPQPPPNAPPNFGPNGQPRTPQQILQEMQQRQQQIEQMQQQQQQQRTNPQ